MRTKVKMIIEKPLAVVFGLLCGLNCNDQGTSGLSDDRWNDSPQVVEIEGRVYDLDVYLFRDFMPPVPPGGRPMKAIIGITVLDSSALPEMLDADTMWAFNGVNVWVVELIGDPELDMPYRFVKVASDGPKWEPYIYVNVFVRLTYGERSYMIKEPDVRISGPQ